MDAVRAEAEPGAAPDALPPGAWTVEAWCRHRAGPRRHDGRRARHLGDGPGYEQGLGRDDRAAAGGAGGQRPPGDVARAGRNGPVCRLDELRQHRQPATGPGRRTCAGARGPRRARCDQGADSAGRVNREPAARLPRRRRGTGDCVGSRAGRTCRPAPCYAAGVHRPRVRCTPDGVHRRVDGRHRRAGRPGPGVVCGTRPDRRHVRRRRAGSNATELGDAGGRSPSAKWRSRCCSCPARPSC